MNADHCLQASIVTTVGAGATSLLLIVVVTPVCDAFLVGAFAALVTAAAFFTLGFDAAADAGGGRSFFAAEAIVRPLPLVDLVDRTIV